MLYSNLKLAQTGTSRSCERAMERSLLGCNLTIREEKGSNPLQERSSSHVLSIILSK